MSIGLELTRLQVGIPCRLEKRRIKREKTKEDDSTEEDKRYRLDRISPGISKIEKKINPHIENGGSK